MALPGSALCRSGHAFVRAFSKSRPASARLPWLVRFKSTDTEKTSEMVVEKEKPDTDYRGKSLNWDNLPDKLTQIKEDLKEAFRHPTQQKMRGRECRDDEVLYYFREKKDLENWYTVADDGVGGKSWAEFVQGENAMTATFRGYLSQKLPQYLLPSSHDKLEEKMIYNGFAYLQTKPFLSVAGREDFTSIFGFNAFEIKLRGDGRTYMFEMSCGYGYEDYMFTIPVYTRGGPDWQTVMIPYSKLIASKNSGYLVTQHQVETSSVKFFRFLLTDRIQGPFQLEIDYIALRTELTEAGHGTDYWDPYENTNSMIGTL